MIRYHIAYVSRANLGLLALAKLLGEGGMVKESIAQ